MEKINICYLISTFRNSGPVKVLYNIIKNLDEERFNVTIITLSKDPKNSLKKSFELLSSKVKIVELNLSRIGGIFLAKRKIKEVIKEGKISIVHSHGLRADNINAGLNVYKNISTLHCNPYIDYTLKYGFAKGSLMAIKHIHVLNKKRIKTICCSKSIQNELKKQLPKSSVIQNGIDEEYFSAPLKKDYYKQQLGIPTDSKVFISTNSLIPRKNNEIVVRAFLKIKEDYRLIFLGDGPEKNKLMKISEQNSNIIFKGFASDVRKYLWASDYFISASTAEGLPNGALEALGSGVQCILTDIQPHIEIFEDNIDLARLFAPDDIDSLVKILKSLFNEENNWLKSRDELKQFFKSHFSSKLMALKYQNFYLDRKNERPFQ